MKTISQIEHKLKQIEDLGVLTNERGKGFKEALEWVLEDI